MSVTDCKAAPVFALLTISLSHRSFASPLSLVNVTFPFLFSGSFFFLCACFLNSYHPPLSLIYFLSPACSLLPSCLRPAHPPVQLWVLFTVSSSIWRVWQVCMEMDGVSKRGEWKWSVSLQRPFSPWHISHERNLKSLIWINNYLITTNTFLNFLF